MGGKKKKGKSTDFFNQLLSSASNAVTLGTVDASLDKGLQYGVTGSELKRVSEKGIHLDPNIRKTQEAKDQANADASQKRKAKEALLKGQDDALKQKIANDAVSNEGSTIILGGKNKKKRKGGSLSSGMGLSTGDTGLQL